MSKYIKIQKIESFLQQYKYLPEQNTNEWKTERTKTIGGSEIAVIQNISPFSNIRKLIDQKMNNVKWSGSIYTWWGKVFEDVVHQWCEIVFNTKIIGSNVFIKGVNVPYEYNNFSYSPDGLGVVNLNELIYDKDNKAVGQSKKNRIVLFEFKSPFNKNIKKNVPPPYYVSQVKTGLDLINITEIGLLVEIVFRRCSWEDLDFTNNYDHILHNDQIKTNALGFGAIFICCPLDIKVQPYEKLIDLYKKEDYDFEETNDFGTCSQELFEEILNLLAQKYLYKFMSSLIIRKECLQRSTAYNLLNSECIEEEYWKLMTTKDIKILGVLPYKVMNIAYHPIDKEIGYLTQYKEDVDNIINLITNCKNVDREIIEKKIFDHFNPNLISDSNVNEDIISSVNKNNSKTTDDYFNYV